jgi:hypothetical protein
LRRARDYRGRDDGLPDSYDQSAMEDINAMTAEFQWGKALFVFRATYDYKGMKTDWMLIDDSNVFLQYM